MIICVTINDIVAVAPYWNVNSVSLINASINGRVAVAPYWNVNLYVVLDEYNVISVAVAPYWSVNKEVTGKIELTIYGSSSSILECK